MTTKRTDYTGSNIIMYGASPDWFPEQQQPVQPFVPLPDLGTEMTTLTRLYNVEQEINRLQVQLAELVDIHKTQQGTLDRVKEVMVNYFEAIINDDRKPAKKVRSKKPVKKAPRRAKR